MSCDCQSWHQISATGSCLLSQICDWLEAQTDLVEVLQRCNATPIDKKWHEHILVIGYHRFGVFCKFMVHLIHESICWFLLPLDAFCICLRAFQVFHNFRAAQRAGSYAERPGHLQSKVQSKLGRFIVGQTCDMFQKVSVQCVGQCQQLLNANTRHIFCDVRKSSV